MTYKEKGLCSVSSLALLSCSIASASVHRAVFSHSHYRNYLYPVRTQQTANCKKLLEPKYQIVFATITCDQLTKQKTHLLHLCSSHFLELNPFEILHAKKKKQTSEREETPGKGVAVCKTASHATEAEH